MRRREFIGLIGSTAAAWPLSAGAENSVPVIGFLRSGSPAESAHLVGAFRRGLSEHGYVEGRSVAVEYRWAEGHYDLLAKLAEDLVRRNVAVIAASGGLVTARAAQKATRSIPIVFVGGDDPVRLGLVSSLNRPGGNITGITLFTSALGAKKLELLSELIPRADAIAFLLNPKNPSTENERNNMEVLARASGKRIHVVEAANESELARAIASLDGRAGALLVAADTFFLAQREMLVALVARRGIPAIYGQREFVTAGGLLSYGSSLTDIYRQLGDYTGRILKGAKPADLPVAQPVKFELVVNLRTAKNLGLKVPETILLRAEEIIE